MSVDGWIIEKGVECVSCPACAFTFDAQHLTVGTDGYTCPACAENALEDALREIDKATEGWTLGLAYTMVEKIRFTARSALKRVAPNGDDLSHLRPASSQEAPQIEEGDQWPGGIRL